ncbi:MAG: hypothetical protein WDW36_003126 [Sanguina aurantia]
MIVKVMFCWLLAYFSTAYIGVPASLMMLGLEREELGVRGQALLDLGVDIAQLGSTLLILYLCLRQFRPRDRGLFPFKWRGWWPLAVVVGFLSFPVVTWFGQQSLVWFPEEAGAVTTHLENSMFLGDWVTNVAYAAVVAVLAPVWEELLFRGFLVSSLLRFLPPWGAVLTSSLVFAMCHFRVQTVLPLTILGVVFGTVFLRCRNLLPAMVLHGSWNVSVLIALYLGQNYW